MPAAAHLLKLLRRLAARGPSRAVVWCVLSLAAAWPALSTAGALVDYRDAEYFTLFEETARIAVVRFHQLPLWNPYYCGGIDALGTPSARFVSPTFLLTLIFGTLRADPLVAFVMVIVGLEGAWRLARSYGASAVGAMAAAPMFALCGFFPRSAALAWTNFWGFELLPWVLLGLRAAVRGSVRGAVAASLAVAWMVCFGGTYAAPVTALACAFELGARLGAIARDRRRRGFADAGHAVAMAVLVVLLAAGVSAVRLWPVADTLSDSPRLLGGADAHAPRDIARMLLSARGTFVIGALAIPAIAIGAVQRRAAAALLAGATWLWLAVGYGGSPSLFALLRTVPPYTMLRAPERFLVPLALVAVVVAALGVSALEAIAKRRPRFVFGALGAIVLLVANAGLLLDNDRAVTGMRTLAPPPPSVEREFAQARGNRWMAAHYPPMSRGTLSCFDDYPVQQSGALRGDLDAEEFVADKDAGTVERRQWSPSRIALHAELRRPARVIVNQNWHPGWRASVGRVVSDDGRLAVDLPEGTHDFALRFLPRHAVGGAMATLIALAAAAAVWRRARKSDRVDAAAFVLSLCPALGACLAIAFVHEPPRAPAALVTPSGEPIVADAPPPDARRLDTRFADGVVLEAVRLGTKGSTMNLELDWRLDRAPPPGIGVFVHVEPEGMDMFNVDHAAVSGVAPFEALPEKKTLRDASPAIALPTADRKTYRVYVGLWRARRDGSRVRIEDKGSAQAAEDERVLVATFVAPSP